MEAILVGIATALAPLMWASYEYLQLKNKSWRHDEISKHNERLEAYITQLDFTSIDNEPLRGRLHEYIKCEQRAIADLSSGLSAPESKPTNPNP